MNTPVFDFLQSYIDSDITRFHMPGHKGQPLLGCEKWDITEVCGADDLYAADGIIAQSEANAAALFGTQKTFYSTEGSSQCIRAMLYLAVTHRRAGTPPVVVAARNVHKSFVYAAALLDLEVVWLWPEESNSICSCSVSAAGLERVLSQLNAPPAAVYITSPNYLGGMEDISALAEVCHKYNTLLLADNAHGAYLRFLQPSLHPMDLGADMCCDSAHKTLPVLTGGAYLHLAKHLPERYAANGKNALALFGSTSPSYLVMASLDLCNKALAPNYAQQLTQSVFSIVQAKQKLTVAGWQVEESDPLRITLRAPQGSTGTELADCLRRGGIECEYADNLFVVLMLTPNNGPEQLEKLLGVMGENTCPQAAKTLLPMACGEQAVSVRQALFLPHESVGVEKAEGRICGAPTVSCPPAIPIVVSGERITKQAVELFRYYGIRQVDVLK